MLRPPIFSWWVPQPAECFLNQAEYRFPWRDRFLYPHLNQNSRGWGPARWKFPLMDSDEHPGLGTMVLASFPTQASPSFQSILCVLPPKPPAVSRTCQALPGSLLCTSVPSTPSAIPPLPICEQTALSSQESAQDSHLRYFPHHPPRPKAGLDASSLALSAPSPAFR